MCRLKFPLYIKGGKVILLLELVFQRECTFNDYLQNGFTLEYMFFKMDPKRTTNGLFNVSTVNNGVAMYPKFVKTNRGVPSVATSTQHTVIKNMYARKSMNKQKIVSHQMKSTLSIATRITQHLIKTANCTRKY